GAMYLNRGRSITVWLHDAIYAKYRKMREWRSLLGLPASGVIPFARLAGCGGQDVCARTQFDGGRLYTKTGVGTFEAHGPVLDYYIQHDGARGPLGFP